MGKVWRLPEFGLGGPPRWTRRPGRSRPRQPVAQQAADVVHVHVGEYHVGHGCEVDPRGLQPQRQPPGLLEVWELQTQPSVDEYRPVAATHYATFSGHSSTSGGRNWSSSQDARSAESAL